MGICVLYGRYGRYGITAYSQLQLHTHCRTYKQTELGKVIRVSLILKNNAQILLCIASSQRKKIKQESYLNLMDLIKPGPSTPIYICTHGVYLGIFHLYPGAPISLHPFFLICLHFYNITHAHSHPLSQLVEPGKIPRVIDDCASEAGRIRCRICTQ